MAEEDVVAICGMLVSTGRAVPPAKWCPEIAEELQGRANDAVVAGLV